MALQTLLLATVAVVIGLIIGVRRGGTLSNLANADLQWWRLFFLGIGLVGLADVAPDLAIDFWLVELGAQGLAVVGLGLLVVFALRNLHLVGMPIIAIGLGLNLLATIANDGFPVDEGALVSARIETSGTVGQASLSGIQHLRTTGDRLWWLGDAIPIRELEHVMSFGDLVIIGGLACTVMHLTRRKNSQPPPPLSTDAHAGLVSIAAPGIRLDEPVLDLALVEQAADHGYAARPDAPSVGDSHDEGEPGPGLGDGTESVSSVGLPILRES